MNIENLLDSVNELVNEYVANMSEVEPEDIGLDSRASYRPLLIDENCIAAYGSSDRVLQYYGGFEYVDKSSRKELGDYVFYMRDNERVDGHIERFEDLQRHQAFVESTQE